MKKLTEATSDELANESRRQFQEATGLPTEMIDRMEVTMGVLQGVLEERIRQDLKFSDQVGKDLPDGTGYFSPWLTRLEDARETYDMAVKSNTLEWQAILAEEFYEAMCEADPVKLRAELMQVAAVCVKWVEAIDRRDK